MASTYKLHAEAFREYIEAYLWYENEQNNLGERFINAVEERVTQICDNPEYYTRIHGVYRQAVVPGFPFLIVYVFFPDRKFVHVSSIYHSSRNPKKKFRKEEP